MKLISIISFKRKTQTLKQLQIMKNELLKEYAREMNTLKTIQKILEPLEATNEKAYSIALLIDEQLQRLYENAGEIVLNQTWNDIS